MTSTGHVLTPIGIKHLRLPICYSRKLLTNLVSFRNFLAHPVYGHLPRFLLSTPGSKPLLAEAQLVTGARLAAEAAAALLKAFAGE
jgi:hypothetical protein